MFCISKKLLLVDSEVDSYSDSNSSTYHRVVTHTEEAHHLYAIGYGVVAHYVRAYVVFAPSAAEHVEDHLDIVGCAVKALVEAVEIVTAAPFLAQCYAVGA